MRYVKTTEQDSKYNDLEKMTVSEILKNINNEDKSVPIAVEKSLPQIEILSTQISNQLKNGGRLFYIGAGTSGRLGIVDASECPPTFGVPHDLVVGLIAGGDTAFRKSVEYAEDSKEQGWKDLKANDISQKDIVVGIAASGTTPYVVSTLEKCNMNNIKTGCITCNKNSPLSNVAMYPVEVVVGPEFLTGSSRMKAGTAQKLVLNMLSTTAMIQLGKVEGNKMVDMQLSNNKLVNRGENILVQTLNVSKDDAHILLKKYGSVRKVIQNYSK